jgi:hypothetical protein
VAYAIKPEPDETEREAILAALDEEEVEQQPASPWAQAVLPERGGELDDPQPGLGYSG